MNPLYPSVINLIVHKGERGKIKISHADEMVRVAQECGVDAININADNVWVSMSVRQKEEAPNEST